jgi:hypothetical protein
MKQYLPSYEVEAETANDLCRQTRDFGGFFVHKQLGALESRHSTKSNRKTNAGAIG